PAIRGRLINLARPSKLPFAAGATSAARDPKRLEASRFGDRPGRGLGVVAADAMGWEPHGWLGQVSAVVAALIAAAFLIWSERHLTAFQEAVIGVVFVVAASAEIILLSYNPHGAEHLKDLLVGQILWVELAQLVPVAVLYALVVVALVFLDLRRRRV